MQLNDADTEASANIAGNTEMLERVPEDKATDTAELRRRIESFSNQPVARSPSFLGESERSHDIHNRTGSVGAARRPSFIKGQEGVSFCGYGKTLELLFFITGINQSTCSRWEARPQP